MLKNNNYTQKYKRTGLSSCSFLLTLYQVIVKENKITPPPKNEIILCAIATVVAVILVYGS